MHCQVEINGGALMMTDMRAPDEPVRKPQGFHLQLVVDDGDLWWNRAVEAGCKVVMPFEKMFWGDRWGLLGTRSASPGRSTSPAPSRPEPDPPTTGRTS